VALVLENRGDLAQRGSLTAKLEDSLQRLAFDLIGNQRARLRSLAIRRISSDVSASLPLPELAGAHAKRGHRPLILGNSSENLTDQLAAGVIMIVDEIAGLCCAHREDGRPHASNVSE
jgi:hypothetical protein